MKDLMKSHLSFLNQERLPSSFNTDDNEYDILIVKTIYFDKHDIREYSHKVVISQESILFFDKEQEVDFAEGIKELRKIIKGNVTKVGQTLINLEDELERMEDQLSKRDFPINFMDNWFHSRDSFLTLERSINRFLRVLNLFTAGCRFLPEKKQTGFRETLTTIEFLERNIASYQKRLEALHHYYTSIKNDKMNKNIYILSILSGVFLPLNLIVGFFGMNTKNLFFENYEKGTQYVLSLIVATFITILVFPYIYGLISKFIVVRFLGRLSFYKRINPFSQNSKSKKD